MERIEADMKKLDGTNNKPIPLRNLAKIRKESGRTQRNLSVMLGFSEELISKYERGLSNPSIASLKRMADFFLPFFLFVIIFAAVH